MGDKMFRFPVRENYNFPGESVSVQMTRVARELPQTVATTVTATPQPSVEVRRTAPSSLQSMAQEGETTFKSYKFL